MALTKGFKLFFLVFFVSTQYLLAQTGGVHLIKKTVVGGEGGWDYVAVASDARQLYLTHGNQVEVLNADTHEKIGVIADTKGVHGVAVVPKTGRGFTTNGRTNTVSVFDTKTFKTLAELPTGKKPDAVFYDAFSERVFVFNNAGSSATVIDAKTSTVIDSIALDGAPEAGISDGKGTIFVNLEDKNVVVAFDAKTLKVKNRWSLDSGEEPTGLALDIKNHRLFSVCHNKLMVILDSETGKVIAKMPIGERVDGVVFDAQNQIAISSNGDGTLTVVKENSPSDFKVAQTVKTEVGARTIALDSKTHHVFVITAQFGEKPAPTPENKNPRAPVLPNSFMVLEYGK